MFQSTSTGRREGSSRRSSTPSSCGTSVSPACNRSTRPATSTGSCTRGFGWIVWRDPDALPDDLVFNVNYLGGNMPTFALNFSRPGNQVAAQYFNLLRLGFDGYRQVQQTCRDVARYASDAIGKMGPFELITDGSELPVFAFALKDGSPYTVFDVSASLRQNGWLVPAYTFPENRQDLAALRVVIRNGMSRDLADLLVSDLKTHVAFLEKLPAPLPQPSHAGFHH